MSLTQAEPTVAQTPPAEPTSSLTADPGAAVADDWTSISRTFETDSPGTYVTELFPVGVNEQIAGEWDPIEPDLTSGGSLGLESTDGPVDVAISPTVDGEQLVSVSLSDGSELAYGIEGAEEVTGDVTDNTVTYEDVTDSADLTIEVLPSGVKETITLSSTADPTEYNFPFSVEGLTAQTDGRTVTFSDENNQPKLVVPPGVMYDSASPPAESDLVSYALIDNGSTLRVSIDDAWINDPARVFPVVVDPSVVAYANNDDTYVNEATPGNNSTALTLNTGRGASGNKNRAFVHFNTAGVEDMNIHQATLNLYQAYSGSCTATPTDVYQIVESYPWSSDESWPGPESFIDFEDPVTTISSGAGGGGSCPAATVTGDVTRAVSQWAHDEVPNRGFALTARDESSYAQFKKFASAQTYTPPSLTIVWTDPTISGHPYEPVGMAPTGMTTSATPTLSAVYDDPEHDQGKLVFRVYNATTGALLSTTASATADYGDLVQTTVDTALPLDTPLEWTVTARDVAGTSYSAATDPIPLIRPSVSISSPSPDAVVGTTTTASGAVASGSGTVEFLLDGTVVASDSTAPYSASGIFAAADAGAHTLQARRSTVTSPPLQVIVDPAAADFDLTLPDLSSFDGSGAEADSIVADFSVSQAVAEDRVAGDFELTDISEQVDALFPTMYAGSWSDDDTGDLTLAVTSEALADALEAKLTTADFSIDVQVVEHSYNDLEQAMDDASRLLFRDPDAAEPEMAPFESFENTIALIDVRANAVTQLQEDTAPTGEVDRAESSLTASNAALSALGSDVEIQFGTSEEDLTSEEVSCGVRDCNDPLRGGVELHPQSCTSGFVAVKNNRFFIMTAGHCVFNEATHVANSNGEVIGNLVALDRQRGGENFEYAVFIVYKPRETFWKPTNVIWRPSDNTESVDHRSRVRGHIGQRICHTGVGMVEAGGDVPDEDCGRVVTDRTCSGLGTCALGLVDTMWVCSGDSGGPVYRTSGYADYPTGGVSAVGLMVSARQPCTGEHLAWYQWVADVEARWRGTVLTWNYPWGTE